jgi:hypothetical protein
MAVSRTITVTTLVLLELLAIKSMHLQIHQNGYYAALVDLRDNGPHLLPGSNIPLKKLYLGIEPIDFVFAVLQCFFANVVDGSAPGLSLFAWQFGGTFGAIVVVAFIEGLRRGSERTVVYL